MSYLIREGMRPITEGFAEAWHKRNSYNPNRKARVLDRPGITREDFEHALEALGLDSSGKLGEVLGVSARRARQIRGEPWSIQRAQLDKIRDVYHKKFSDAYDAYKEFEILEEQAPGSYASEKEEADKRVRDIVKSARVLYADEYFNSDECGRLIRQEFEARALVEGSNLLSADDRRVLFRTLQGLLVSNGGPVTSEQYGKRVRIANAIEAAKHFTVCESDLGNLIASDDLYECIHSNDDETAINMLLDAIDEYAGIDDSDQM